MEWYMCRDGGEMIVPQDQELSEQSVSQDNSFQWEEGLSMCGELPVSNYGVWASETRLVGDWLEYQLHGLSEMDQMNDNFMSSFLQEDLPQMRNTYQSVGMFSESKCSTVPFDNLLKDVDMDSQSIPKDQWRREDLKYLEVPSSMDWDKLDGPSTSISYDSEKEKGSLSRNISASWRSLVALVPAVESCQALGSETNTSPMADGQLDEETSMEENALQELEVAMTQLTQETRICFRDALYRLARSSEQLHLKDEKRIVKHTINETAVSNDQRETSRAGKAERVEFGSNQYDSTVAHLMFNKINRKGVDLYGV
ncbi:hypothetical protein IFM89_028394 [Coptis chinensis]|uniref:Protein LNK3 n=1 Tax=Coptis chinensis TaxID=261450 RepID=A0A835H5Y3_9MAGN|nr:hypothetical protein IFM89_028394 [Coptis chinensis]